MSEQILEFSVGGAAGGWYVEVGGVDVADLHIVLHSHLTVAAVPIHFHKASAWGESPARTNLVWRTSLHTNTERVRTETFLCSNIKNIEFIYHVNFEYNF